MIINFYSFHKLRISMFSCPKHIDFVYRYLHTLKQYVRNKARPEGSIAEAYIDNECLTFCSMYLRGIETRFNREDRNADEGQEHEQGLISVFAHNVRPLGSPTFQDMDPRDQAKARWYVLHNCEEIESYLE